MSNTAALPPPLPLARIHRLLRPLRSTLSTLLSSLHAADARASAPNPRRDAKGKGKERADLDLDYGSAANRLKRKTAPQPVASSSPFTTSRAKKPRHKATATYGSRRPPVASTSRTGASSELGGKAPRVRVVSAPVDLASSGFDSDTIVKITHVLKAYGNVLECVYGIDRRGTDAEENTPRTEVVTLVESMARRVGWDIEDAVRSCLVGGDDDDASPVPELEEDETQLVDEWYEAVPPYARSWMLGHHATAVVLDGLQDESPAILLSLLEIANSLNATAEATLFYPPLLSLGFSLPTSWYSLANPSSQALSLSLLAPTSQRTFFTALERTLLASTFADRLFFSGFLDLSRIPLYTGDASPVARLLNVVTSVAVPMLDAISKASCPSSDTDSNSDSDEEDDDGSEELAEEVILRLAAQLERALPVLLAPPLDSQPGPRPLHSLTTSLSHLLHSFPSPTPNIECLSPLLLVLHLSLLAHSPTSTINPPLPPLLALSSILPSATLHSHLPTLLESLSTQSLLGLAVLLHSSPDEALRALEQPLLRVAVEGYDDLVDVRGTKGLEVFGKEVFRERLEERRVAAGDLQEVEPEAEEMDVFLEEKEAPKERTKKARRRAVDMVPTDEAGEDEWRGAVEGTPGRSGATPLAQSSLGRPFNLRERKREAGRTPSKVLGERRARLGRVGTYVEPPSEVEDESDASGDEETGSEDEGDETMMALEYGGDGQGEDRVEEGETGDLESDAGSPAAVEVIELSDVEDEDDDAFTIKILDRPPPHIPTSEPDDLDLLAIARPKKRSRPAKVAPKPVTSRRVRFGAAKGRTEESEDELAM